MNLRSVIVFILLAFPGVCHPQVRPRVSQPSAPPAYMQQLRSFDQAGTFTEVVLKNGMTILVTEAHATPLAEVLTLIKAGARDEPAGMPGVSAVMARMLLRGTPTRSAATLALDVRTMGGALNSLASYETTSIRIDVPAGQWKRAVEIQADAVLNPLFDEAELKRQIALIQGEAARQLSDPDTLIRARLMATGFAGEKLKFVKPSPTAVAGDITRDKLMAYYRTACSAEKILLVVSGDVTASDVLAAAVGLFAGAKGPTTAENRPVEGSPEPGFRYEQIRGESRTARIMFGFRTAAATDPDFLALEVLRAVLGVGEGSMLNRRLKYQKGLVHDADIELAGFSDGGYLRIGMDLDPKNFDRCEIALFTELEILKRMEPELGELERARAQLKREFWEVNGTVEGRAERVARLESFGSWKPINTYLTRLGQVKWADVARVAARYLSLENCALVEYLPAQAEARPVRGETIRDTIQELLTPAVKQEMDEREKLTVPAIDIPEASDPFTPSDVRNPFQIASILRGPELFIREDHTMPLIHLGLFFAGGKLVEQKANAGITSLLLRTMLRDSKNKSAEQIYRQLEVYGGALSPVVEDDYFGIDLKILSPYVEQGLGLLSEIVKSPKLDSDEIERQRALQKAALDGRNEAVLAQLRLKGLLFPDYSYALDRNGSDESLAGITAEAVQGWYRSSVADKKPVVVILGDTQGSSLAGFFVRNFSGSRFQDISLPEKFAPALEKKEIAESGWRMSFSSIMMGLQAPPEADEDSFVVQVLERYVDGFAGRLAGPIQDRLRSAFEASALYDPRLRGGSLNMSLSVMPADEDDAWKAFSEELARIIAAPVQYRDYRAAVNSAVAEVQFRQQDRWQQIADVVKSALSGKGIAGFQEYISRLQEVKQADLQEAVKRYLKIERSVALRLHGKSLPWPAASVDPVGPAVKQQPELSVRRTCGAVYH